MNISQQPFSILIKPASADCNLRCKYCFYLEHCSFYPETKRHRMPAAVLEQLIKTYMSTRQPSYQFGWQGGEPTLMGVDFFRRVVELQQKYGANGASVANGLQTNGTLISDEMSRLFAQYHFLLGVSVDGPRELHDRYRLTTADSGSHADVLRGLARLQDHKVEFNILTLVSEANVRQPRDVYDYLCNQGFLFHQYIPCVEPDINRRLLPFSISGPAWGDFLCAVFDAWYPQDVRRVSIRLFDSILALLVDGTRNVCHFGNNCCQYFVVEYNGDIYPCDFFVETRLKLGNIMHDSWTILRQSPLYHDFGALKKQHNATCESCDFLQICNGDCLKHRLCGGAGSPQRLSVLCEGWKLFYQHALPRLQELATQIVTERQQVQKPLHASFVSPGAEPGRNAACPCGSDRKFKKCCGSRQ